jgi:hypothetical protein
MTEPGRFHPIWAGWVLFVGILLGGAGVVNTVQGLVAVFDSGFSVAATAHLAIDVNYTLWGWTSVVLGATLVAAGCGVMLGYAWARVVGVVVASVNALVNLAFVTPYPGWSLLAIGFDILAVYALVVHGGEAKALRIRRR